jgi:hypothetical protein
LLVGGNYADGFEDYEWRRRLAGIADTHSALEAPTWTGDDPAGRTILVVAEQGFGDTLQFCRYVPHLATRGAKVVLVVQEALADLCRTLDGVESVVASGGPLPAFDLTAPLLSLPHLMSLGPEPALYLAAPVDRVERWRGTFNGRIGIAWQGNPEGAGDRGRSVSISRYLDLATVDGVGLVSLQKGFGHEQLGDVPSAVDIEDAGDHCTDFADTAAVMADLDLVITTDTAVAHLAGGLGGPTWGALKYDPDWRWHLGRDNSPWYPNLRMFRQPAAGDWDTVFADIRKALESWRPTDL